SIHKNNRTTLFAAPARKCRTDPSLRSIKCETCLAFQGIPVQFPKSNARSIVFAAVHRRCHFRREQDQRNPARGFQVVAVCPLSHCQSLRATICAGHRATALRPERETPRAPYTASSIEGACS